MTYSELEKLPVEVYLKPSNFVTEYDKLSCNVARQEQRRQAGLENGKSYAYVFINARSVWGASGLDGSSTTSYEGIGYHANTASWYAGILASNCPVFVQRRSGEWFYLDTDKGECVPVPAGMSKADFLESNWRLVGTDHD